MAKRKKQKFASKGTKVRKLSGTKKATFGSGIRNLQNFISSAAGGLKRLTMKPHSSPSTHTDASGKTVPHDGDWRNRKRE